MLWSLRNLNAQRSRKSDVLYVLTYKNKIVKTYFSPRPTSFQTTFTSFGREPKNPQPVLNHRTRKYLLMEISKLCLGIFLTQKEKFPVFIFFCGCEWNDVAGSLSDGFNRRMQDPHLAWESLTSQYRNSVRNFWWHLSVTPYSKGDNGQSR